MLQLPSISILVLSCFISEKVIKVSSCIQWHMNEFFVRIVSQIHFGVSGGLPRFALENQAVNDATFACPDELGWKPQVALLRNCLFS